MKTTIHYISSGPSIGHIGWISKPRGLEFRFSAAWAQTLTKRRIRRRLADRKSKISLELLRF